MARRHKARDPKGVGEGAPKGGKEEKREGEREEGEERSRGLTLERRGEKASGCAPLAVVSYLSLRQQQAPVDGARCPKRKRPA